MGNNLSSRLRGPTTPHTVKSRSNSQKSNNAATKDADAAIKIQRFYKKRTGKKQYGTICSIEPVNLPVPRKDFNIYLSKNEEKINLLSVTHLKKKSHEIPGPQFFKDFYDLLVLEFPIFHQHQFRMSKIGNNLQVQLLVDDVNHHISIYFNEENKQAKINKVIEIYSQHLYSHFVPYLLYLLSNSGIELEEYENEIIVRFTHPHNVSGISGIHKDDTLYTCITYVNSPLSTELAFDVKEVDLPWLQCSPLFRFESSNKLFTLYFRDKYIQHTLPIWEEEGIDASVLNPLGDYYTMRIVDNDTDSSSKNQKIVFGNMQTSTEGRVAQKLENGKVTTLPLKEAVDSYGKPYPLTNVENTTFLKQRARQKVSKPSIREILTVFITASSYYPIHRTETLPLSSLDNYKNETKVEQIELTSDLVDAILSKNELAGLEFKGGKKRSTRRRK
jgi:hypothetical protein